MTAPTDTGFDPALDAALLEILCWIWPRSAAEKLPLRAPARELLLDTLGCAIAGRADPVVAALFQEASVADPGTPAFFLIIAAQLNGGDQTHLSQGFEALKRLRSFWWRLARAAR